MAKRQAIEERTQGFVTTAQDVIEEFLGARDIPCPECQTIVRARPLDRLQFQAAVKVMEMAGVGPISRRREEAPLTGDVFQDLVSALKNLEPGQREQIVAALQDGEAPAQVM